MLEIPEGSTWQIGGGNVSLGSSFLAGVLDRRFLCGCTDSLGSMDFFVSITDMFFILKGAISLEIMVEVNTWFSCTAVSKSSDEESRKVEEDSD